MTPVPISWSFPSSPPPATRPRTLPPAAGFLRAASTRSLELIAAEPRIVVLVGTPWLDRDLANACAVCAEGEILGVYRKHFLPNYGVFDEHRYFAEGRDLVLLRFGDAYVGPTICEDVWQPGPPATDLALAGAQLIVNLSASPFHVGKAEDREEMLVTRARHELVLRVLQPRRRPGRARLRRALRRPRRRGGGRRAGAGFEEHLLVVDLDPLEAIGRRLRDVRRRELERSRESLADARARRGGARPERSAPPGRSSFEDELEQMRLALTLGLRDYVDKNGFTEVVVGVSGGIDSAVTAALCARTRWASARATAYRCRPGSLGGDAERRAPRRRGLGCRYRELPIESTVGAFHDAVLRRDRGRARGLAAENLQARVRGVLLMALSNTYGWLVVSTGNKSELAVGYSTLYGDMVDGFALLKDVFKTDVYRLAEHLNERAGRERHPASRRSSGGRAPSSATTNATRTSIPEYDALDPVLEAYVERGPRP